MPISKAVDKNVWTADSSPKRRSMRVLLSVPVAVSGKTAKGKEFNEETRTLVVNAHGALVSLAAELTKGHKLTLTNLTTKQALECIVTHIGPAQAGKTQIGLEFSTRAPSFWKVDFPPDDWVVPED